MTASIRAGFGAIAIALVLELMLVVLLPSESAVTRASALPWPRPEAARRVQPWVAFGDSVTVGIGATQDASSYVGRLRRLIGSIDNRGINATTIARQRQAIAAYDGQADHVLWLAGYNDMRAGTSLDTVRTELSQALDLLAQRHASVYLGLCLRMTPVGYQAYGPAWNHGSEDRVRAMNDVLRTVAAGFPNVTVVDMTSYDPMNGVSLDHVHPNDLGHWQVARAFGCAITTTRDAEWHCDELNRGR